MLNPKESDVIVGVTELVSEPDPLDFAADSDILGLLVMGELPNVFGRLVESAVVVSMLAIEVFVIPEVMMFVLDV